MAADEHPKSARVDEIGEAILDYLAENPGSSDTIEGIVEWWLMEHHIRQETARVQRAVDRLVESGLLDARRSPDGRCHYSRPSDVAEHGDEANPQSNRERSDG